MENNDFLENLTNMLEDSNMKSKHVKVVYLDEYVKRNELGFYSKAKQSSVRGEIVTETTLYFKKFHCQHVCMGKANWGMELSEPINTKDNQLKRLVNQQGYFVVCKLCVKECAKCGRLTSRISGVKKNGTWLCHDCKKEIEWAEFWQRIRSMLGGVR